ncbi:MAG: peptidylprolyl isomerase [Clostridia bacterium]|nr:peptidylprolyl isomerase [Clostridia bacterium]
MVATINGQEITVAELENNAQLLYNAGYVETYPDYDAALESMIREAVVKDHLQKAGYLDYSEEELAAFTNDAQAQWDQLVSTYVERYLTEDTEEARATLKTQAEQYFATMGGSVEVLTDDLMYDAAMEKLQEDLTGGYVPTEEEIQQVFDLYGAQYQAQYENNVGMYEFYTQYYGYESWYVPEGYRAVIHILLNVDADVLKAYTDAQAALDEAESAEDPDEAAIAEAKAAAEAAKAAVIASRQDVIDDIYARLEKGESFQSLIAEYGNDPGMQDETMLAEGYHVHAESILWDPAFTEGAFQEGMRQPGDVSQPVVGTYGIHILYYLKDVPGGLLMTDSIHDEIYEYLLSSKASNAFNAGYAEWQQELEIVRNDAVLEQLKAEAEAEAEAAEKAE